MNNDSDLLYINIYGLYEGNREMLIKGHIVGVM